MNLKKLNNRELETSLVRLVQHEREILHLVLQHMLEIETRKLYLERSCSSLFQYMTQELHYSGPSAQRRIEAMRLMKSVPTISEKIQKGSINLSQVEVISRAVKQKEKESKCSLSKEDKHELVSLVENKDISSAQKIVAEVLDIALKPAETKIVQKDESVHISLTLSKDQYTKLLACKDLAAHLLLQRKALDLTDLIEVLADKFIESKTWKPGTFSRASSAEKASVSDRKPEGSKEGEAGTVNQTLTPKTKKQIMAIQKSCQYRDPRTQQICGSRFALEIDHKTSQWAGGNHDHNNLQVLCASHNKYKYRQEAGFRFR